MDMRKSLALYYADANVRARMLEFLGGDSLDNVSAYYITSKTEEYVEDPETLPPRELWRCLDHQRDVGRSLWDRESLLVDLDIEYVNFDYPIQPFLLPDRVFKLQEVVERTVEKVLSRFGIRPLHLISGRGHHFVWRVGRETPAHQRLESFGRVPDFLAGFYAAPQGRQRQPVATATQRGWAGLALLMEYLAHLIKEEAAPASEVPVELTAVAVGPGYLGREMISVDISEYGDPASLRTLRLPFSAYLKPWQQREELGDRFVDRLAAMFLIPLHEMSVEQAIEVMRDSEAAAALAARVTVQIPEQNEPMLRLIDAYGSSDLARFHNHFYEQEHDAPAHWNETYDLFPLHLLPPCIQRIIECPNDLLLQPAGIAQVVRGLLALGWHPRHIAGLIRSKYERDFGWGTRWYKENAGI
ncbi:MAG: hypothetical protein HYV26_09265, partial [Candidatus Hydrogenedentes bacterium]|nr:hypothetical protein [Candidatus Hydrogenedentota bacterium]